MTIEPLTPEVLQRLIDVGYCCFVIKQQYEKDQYGNTDGFTMLEALKSEPAHSKHTCLTREHLEDMITAAANYCVMYAGEAHIAYAE